MFTTQAGIAESVMAFTRDVKASLDRIASEPSEVVRKGLRPQADNAAGSSVNAWEAPLTRRLERELGASYEIGDRRYPARATSCISRIREEFPNANRGETWNECDLKVSLGSLGWMWVECKAVFEKIIPRDRFKAAASQRDYTGKTATRKNAQTKKSIGEIRVDARKLECLSRPDASVVALLVLGFDTVGNDVADMPSFIELKDWLRSQGWSTAPPFHWSDASPVRAETFKEHLWFWFKSTDRATGESFLRSEAGLTA